VTNDGFLATRLYFHFSPQGFRFLLRVAFQDFLVPPVFIIL
jgi:hypothetical protein